MSSPKTKLTDASVDEFLNKVENSQKREDCFKIKEMMEKITGKPAQLWGNSLSMVGFDKYHYKSDKSKQEGDWPVTGFSPRASSISLYVIPHFTSPEVNQKAEELLSKIGKHKRGMGCLYINKLSDIDEKVLIELTELMVKNLKEKYGLK